MTRKDYVAIAGAIHRTRQFFDGEVASNSHRNAMRVALGELTHELANVLAADNSRFDRGRFEDAARRGMNA